MLDWLFNISTTSPVAQAVGLLALTCAAGMACGGIEFQGIRLGSAGVLFTGIVVAHLSEAIDKRTLDFVKEFGLVLFVFTLGLHLGPGFFASLRSEGWRLNILAFALILMAGALTPVLGWSCGLEKESWAGLFAGASTNSPALGAAQQTLASLPDVTSDRLMLPALACAVAYPVGIVGTFIAIIGLKILFRVEPVREAEKYADSHRQQHEPVFRRTLVVENPELVGLSLQDIYGRTGENVVVSRIRSARETEVRIALRDSIIRAEDVLLAVGTAESLSRFEHHVGRKSAENLLVTPGDLTSRQVVVTHKRALGKSPSDLNMEGRFGVELTRVTRGDIELTAVGNLRLQFGDVVQVVGPPSQISEAADFLGNSLKRLNETHFVPLFLGIFLGVLVGSVPIMIPGLSMPIRLGLAGGPLIVALCLGRIGHLGGLVWHIPLNASLAFREFGISLFFAALGLSAGDQFFATVVGPGGLGWAVSGLLVTVVPLLAIGIWSRLVLKMDFVTLGGMLSGVMTNPPALTFVNNLCRSESPALAYATVYPLTTVLRIVTAQMLTLLFHG